MKIVKSLLMMAVVALFWTSPTWADTETIDGVLWVYSVADGTATVTGVGEGDGDGLDVVIPSTLGGYPVTAIGEDAFLWKERVETILIPEGVTNIAAWAFCNCTGLHHVTIPDTVTYLGPHAFRGASSLRYLFVPDSWEETDMLAGTDYGSCQVLYGSRLETETVDGVTWTYAVGHGTAMILYPGPRAFSGNITIPPVLGGVPVTAIGNKVFYSCDVESVAIPDGVTSIGDSAFIYCRSLTFLKIPAAVTNIGSEAFRYCSSLTSVAIPDGVTVVAPDTFNSCNALTSMEIPNGVTNIGKSAFWGCSALTNLTLGSGVERIEEYAFDRCSGLTSVAIPDSVTDIGPGAFSYCNELAVVSIGNGVTNIWTSAFGACERLLSIEVADGNGFYESGDGVLFDKGKSTLLRCPGGKNGVCAIPGSVANIEVGAFADCSGLTGVTIPGSVTNIGASAFYECSGLTTATVPDSVASIGIYAFYGCDGLTNLTIGNGVTDIGEYTFYGCSGLTDVTVPDSVTSIGDYAFYGCSELEKAVIGDGVTTIGEQAFNGCSGLEDLTIGSGVETIAQFAFCGCTGLTSVAIPDSVTAIGWYAFKDCDGLLQMEVPLAWYGMIVEDSFYGKWEWFLAAGVPSDCKVVYRGADSETVDGVTWNYIVSDGAAMMLSGDYSGDLPIPGVMGGHPVAGISEYAFSGCSGLTGVTVPDSVTNIGKYAFSGCNGLEKVVIGDGVASIGSGAFSGCSSLASLEVPGAWYGTDALDMDDAGVPAECTVIYRGIDVLSVATESLPNGEVHAAYEATLAATGGIGPYTWRLGGEYAETAAGGTYTETGMGQGWQGDNSCWDLALPFAFPYFGGAYTNARINSNGAISFGPYWFAEYPYSEGPYWTSPIIAVLWNDLKTSDIYVTDGDGAVTVRWVGTYYSGGAVNFSATLCKDGRIVLSYGEGNEYGGTIGISAGDGMASLLSAKSGKNMSNANDIVFSPPKGLPPGMELAADGEVRGMPEERGRYAFTAVVTDAKGVTASRELTLTVAGEGGGEETATTPVAVPHAWLDGEATDILAANGGDYEAAAKAAAANGKSVWECYVAGLSTTNATAEFKVKSISFENGRPVVKWDPDLDEDRAYTVQGKPTMTNDWGATNASSRFFRVLVELPK